MIPARVWIAAGLALSFAATAPAAEAKSKGQKGAHAAPGAKKRANKKRAAAPKSEVKKEEEDATKSELKGESAVKPSEEATTETSAEKKTARDDKPRDEKERDEAQRGANARVAAAWRTSDGKDTTGGDGTTSDPTKRPISVAPVVGFATNNLGLGVGLRAGYTLPMRVYLGATFVYQHGSSFGPVRAYAFYPGAEVGYDASLGPVVLKPYLGAGLLVAKVTGLSGLGAGAAGGESFALWPGVAATYEIPKSPAFVGADARLLIATRGGDPSLGLFLTGGARF